MYLWIFLGGMIELQLDCDLITCPLMFVHNVADTNNRVTVRSDPWSNR